MEKDFISEEDAWLIREAMGTALIGISAWDDEANKPEEPHIWVVVDEFLAPHGYEKLEMPLRFALETDIDSHRIWGTGEIVDNRESRFLRHMLKALDEWEASEKARAECA